MSSRSRGDEAMVAGGAPATADAVETTSRSVAKGGLWNLASNALPQLYVVAVSIAAARFLGASAFGRQSFIAFVEFSVAVVASAGIPNTITRFTAESVGRGDRAMLRVLLRWGSRVALAGAVCASCALVGIGVAGASPQNAWFFAAASVAAQVLARVPSSYLTGLQRWREPSVATLVVGFGSMAFTIAVLAAGGGIVGMFAVEASAAVTAFIWLALLGGRHRPAAAAIPPHSRVGRPVLRFALFTWVGTLITLVLYRRSEFFFLSHYSTNQQIALYSVAFAAVSALLLITQPFVGVALPAVATLWGQGSHDRIRTGYARAVRLLLFVSFPITAGAVALGPELMRLVYGPEFDSVGPVLIVLLAPFPIFSAMSLSSVTLTAIGKLGLPLATAAVAAVLNIGLDFALIPPYGAVGAAFANSGAQLAAAIPIIFYAQRLIGVSALDNWRPLIRPALVSTVGGIAAWLMLWWISGAAGLVAGIGVGVAVFAVLGSALKILSAEDARWLEQAAGPRLGGAVRIVTGRLAPAG